MYLFKIIGDWRIDNNYYQWGKPYEDDKAFVLCNVLQQSKPKIKTQVHKIKKILKVKYKR